MIQTTLATLVTTSAIKFGWPVVNSFQFNDRREVTRNNNRRDRQQHTLGSTRSHHGRRGRLHCTAWRTRTRHRLVDQIKICYPLSHQRHYHLICLRINRHRMRRHITCIKVWASIPGATSMTASIRSGAPVLLSFAKFWSPAM